MQANQENIERLVAQLRASGSGGRLPPPLVPYNQGGGSGPPRATEEPLKARVDFLQTAFLWLTGALVTAVIGIIAIAVTMTNATNTRLDKASDGLSTLNREVGQVSSKIDQTNQQLGKMDDKIDRIASKLDKR